jgi:hypothetical protein
VVADENDDHRFRFLINFPARRSWAMCSSTALPNWSSSFRVTPYSLKNGFTNRLFWMVSPELQRTRDRAFGFSYFSG